MAGVSEAGQHPYARLTARRGVALLHLYMQEWWQQRMQLRALGVEDVDQVDNVLAEAAEAPVAGEALTREQRSARIAALVAAAGG